MIGLSGRSCVAIVVALVAAPAVRAGQALPATGTMGGEPVATDVDSAVARILLADADAAGRARLAPATRAELARADGLPLTVDLGRRLTAALSIDAAAIYLAHRIVGAPGNRALRSRFDSILAALRGGADAEPRSLRAPPGAIVAFVPGFGWRSDRTTGADFARQRALLERLGVRTRLIETVEDGTVEENATLVARGLDELARSYERIYLVSASKGGPEAALALMRASPAALARLEAWLSVGGLLRGSPYADRFTSGIAGWFARVVFSFKGLGGTSIADLSTGVRRAAMESFVLPAGVRAIAWIGVPLSGQVRDEVRGRWEAIGPHGPNDGLTLLVDELIPGGRVLVSPGLDHYFRDPEIDLKVAALTAILFAEGAAGELQLGS